MVTWCNLHMLSRVRMEQLPSQSHTPYMQNVGQHQLQLQKLS
jgi:hypothetical protein